MKAHPHRNSIVLSLSLLGFWANQAHADNVPPQVVTTVAKDINATDGTLQMENVDVSIGNLSLIRFGQGSYEPWPYPFPSNSHFAMGMTSDFDIYVMANLEKATPQPKYYPARYHPIVHIGRGASGVYTQSLSRKPPIYRLNYDAYSGILDMNGSAYVYTDKDGTIYNFNPNVSAGGGITGFSQRVDNIVYADGNVRNFSYDSSGNLHLVKDARGYAIIMDYGTNGYVTAACAVDTARTYVSFSSTCSGMDLVARYDYAQNLDNNGNPYRFYNSAFTDPSGKKTYYTVGNTGRLTCIRPDSYTGCKISVTNYGANEVLADGSTWQLSAGDGSNMPNDPDYNAAGDSIGWSSFTNPLGKKVSMNFEKNSMTSYTDELGRTTSYKWIGGALNETIYYQTTDGNELTEVDFPEGNKYFASYGPFNVLSYQKWTAKPGSNLPDKIVWYNFGTWGNAGVTYQNWAKPLSKTDENGNETDWTYTTYGKVVSELLPAPISGAGRPLKLYTYVQKSAYILNSSGSLVSSGTPIWLPDTETTCQTFAGSNALTCDSGAPKLTTTYIYGADGTADNLLPRGVIISDGTTNRVTCYTYDKYSHKISETLPNANLASCS